MLPKIKAILKEKNFRVLERPFELNLVALRSKDSIPGCFQDELLVFYRAGKDKWNTHLFKCTTDPCTFWLDRVDFPKDSPLLKEGQYENAYSIEKVKGEKIFLQTSPVNVLTGFKRKSILAGDTAITEKANGGINICPPSGRKKVDRDLDMCQVLEKEKDYKELLSLGENHIRLYGNSFTFALIDFRCKRKKQLGFLLKSISVLSALGASYYENE